MVNVVVSGLAIHKRLEVDRLKSFGDFLGVYFLIVFSVTDLNIALENTKIHSFYIFYFVKIGR